jgi:CheY-like chemotaxis protein
VIEDHQDTREFFGLVLRNVGHEVQLARDGEEGIAICRRWPPDIVVIDVTMSDDYAAELVRELREDCRGSRVLAFSSGGVIGADKRSVDVLAEAEQLGADLVLRKPVDPEILLQSVAALRGEPPSPGR